MNNPGIDYSRGMSNVDRKTGIHYGVISQNEVLQAWADSSGPFYGPATCPDCGNEVVLIAEGISEQLSNGVAVYNDTFHCEHCKKDIDQDDMGFDEQEPLSYTLDDGEYIAECGENGDIFIIKSPYYTYAQYCSPCAPGAGYLMNYWKLEERYQKASDTLDKIDPQGKGERVQMEAYRDGFPKVYCFDASWFDDNKAPYPVFSVETGKLIHPCQCGCGMIVED